MPYVLIAGAGKVGYHLASLLSETGYRVSVVDRDEGACRKIAEEINAVAICGDATEIDVLGDAGGKLADYVVAATGRDEDNLAVCRIAKTRYGGAQVIARVINPKNEVLYRLAGADSIIDPTTMAARTIRDALSIEGMRLLSVFESADASLAELELTALSPAAGRRVSDLSLSEDCVLIALVRAGSVKFARGGTILAAGDRVYALARRQAMDGLRTALIGRRT